MKPGIDTDIRGWQGYRMTVGDLSVGVVPCLGGRILSLVTQGEELMFAQPEHRGETFDLAAVNDLRSEKRRLGFRLWGGDKTWISPQSEWWEGIPPLDLDAGRYEARVGDGCVTMTSPVCRETGLRLVRTVEVRDDGEIVLTQEIRNEGSRECARGIWDVTQCLRPFDVFVPAPEIRGYPEEGDSLSCLKTVVTREGNWARIACRQPAHFKFGGLAETGAVVSLRPAGGRTLAFVRSFETDPRARHAHGASVEVYNSPSYDYLEVEIHAPLVPLAPGGSVTHVQRWKILRLDGEAGPDGAWTAAFPATGT